jgi:hypothetical protein
MIGQAQRWRHHGQCRLREPAVGVARLVADDGRRQPRA